MFVLGKEEFKQLADIAMGIGHVCLGSIVIPFLINQADQSIVITGVFFACVAWITSVYFAMKMKTYD